MVQAAVVVTTVRDIAGCAYEADAPVLDGRGGISSPRGWLVSNLCLLAMFVRSTKGSVVLITPWFDLTFLFLFVAALDTIAFAPSRGIR